MAGPGGVPAALLAAVLAALALRLALTPSGRAAARRLRRRSGGTPSRAGRGVPGPVLLDLAAAVLRAGAPTTTCLRLLADCLAGHDPLAARSLLGLAARHEAAVPVPLPPGAGPAWLLRLDAALVLARDAGTGPAPLLAAAAEEERRRTAASARAAAARLGVRVVLPAGLCLLPAFVLLTVVPMVLALVR